MNKKTLFRGAAWFGVAYLISVIVGAIFYFTKFQFFTSVYHFAIPGPGLGPQPGTFVVNCWVLWGLLLLPAFYSLSIIGKEISSRLLTLSAYVGYLYAILVLFMNFGFSGLIGAGYAWVNIFALFVCAISIIYAIIFWLVFFTMGEKLNLSSTTTDWGIWAFGLLSLFGLFFGIVTVSLIVAPPASVTLPVLAFPLLLLANTSGLLLIITSLILTPILFKRAVGK